VTADPLGVADMPSPSPIALDAAGPRHRTRRTPIPWWAWGAAVVLAGQLAVLLVMTVRNYDSFNLSLDYSTFNQAWHQIAHGNLDPTNTILAIPYWQNHGEWIMWPLSLLYWLSPNDGLTLLVLQALAIVAGEAIAVSWLVAVARRRQLSPALTGVCVAGLLVLLVADPWPYRIVVEDFHFQAIAACFVIGAARDLWLGRTVRVWVWVALACTTGDVAGTYLFGLGLAFALTTPGRRRTGLAVGAVGIAWTLLLGHLGADKGSALDTFWYLAAPKAGQQPGTGSVVLGALTHPSRPIHQLLTYSQAIGDNLAPTGLLGLLNPWTFGVVLANLLLDGLSADRAFIAPGSQNALVYLFGAAGTMLTVVVVAGWRRVRSWMTVALVVLVVAGAVVFDAVTFSHGNLDWSTVPAAEVPELQAARAATPAGAEVIATVGVIGRFSGRRYAYPIDTISTFPVHARTVVIVIAPTAGNQPVPPAAFAGVRALITGTLHAATLVDGPTVWAYLWHPPPGTHQVDLVPPAP
jgi:Predicted membrane protein (DUF2079)